MKTEKSLLRVCLIGLILSGCASLTACKKEGPHIDELCQLNGDGSAECSDGEESHHKDSGDLINYIALSPTNYEKLLDWGRESGAVQQLKLSDQLDWSFLEAFRSEL